MSCMEHTCVDCHEMVFNNSRGPSICPKCGGDMHHIWDEQQDYNREREERDREQEGF